jgi:hypothetical protein
MAATVSNLYKTMISVFPEKRLIDCDTKLPFDDKLKKPFLEAVVKKDVKAMNEVLWQFAVIIFSK